MSPEPEQPQSAEQPVASPFGGVGRHTLVYGAGILLSGSVSFLMLPIYTRLLTPADYGVMELIELALDLIATVAGARMAVGIFRFYHKAESEQERQRVVSTAFLVLSASYLGVGLLTFLGADLLARLIFPENPAHAGLIRIAAGSLACTSLTLTPLTFARVRDRSLLFVRATVVLIALRVAFNLLFLIPLEMGVKGVFLSNLLANLLVGSVLAVSLVREVGLGYSLAATRDLLRYGIPLIGTQLATFVTAYADFFVLKAVADDAVVGLYALAYRFGFMVSQLGYMPFEMVWEGARFAVARRPDRDAVLARGFLYLNLLLISAATGLALFAEDVLRLMAAPAFHPAAAVVPLILVAYVFQGWAGTQDIGVLMREKTGYITLANVVSAVVAVVGYGIFIPRYLAWGAAGVTLVAFAVRYLGVYVASQRLWPVRYRWGPVWRLVGLALAVSAIGLALPPLEFARALLVKSTLFAIYLAGAWKLGVLNDEERHELAGLARSLLEALRGLRREERPEEGPGPGEDGHG